MSQTHLVCPQCGQRCRADGVLQGQTVQCPQCSALFAANLSSREPPPTETLPAIAPERGDAMSDAQRIASRLGHRVTDMAGIERLEGFSLKELFSEVFKKHSSDEVEEYFTVGTQGTTPPILAVDTTWPKPWVFFRTFLGALAVYLLFLAGWNEFGNTNLVPGLIIMGSFAVPIATLIFFVEINARKNVSLYQVIRLVFLGGILSLIISLIFFQVMEIAQLGWLGASVAGLAEEPGKLLALLAVAHIPKYRYRLNGLLFGAAVGTGFAAFESAGYALRYGLSDASQMKDVIMIRGMLSPFGHIVWTAMCGAALWRVKGEQKFSLSMVTDPRFLRIFCIAVVLHMIWNSPISLPFYAKNVALGVIAWIIIFALIQDGLKELREEKERARKSAP
jgi:protease PrsW